MQINLPFALFVSTFNESPAFQKFVFDSMVPKVDLYEKVKKIVSANFANKIPAIKAIREITGYSADEWRAAFPSVRIELASGINLGLADAKYVFESFPLEIRG